MVHLIRLGHQNNPWNNIPPMCLHLFNSGKIGCVKLEEQMIVHKTLPYSLANDSWNLSKLNQHEDENALNYL